MVGHEHTYSRQGKRNTPGGSASPGKDFGIHTQLFGDGLGVGPLMEVLWFAQSLEFFACHGIGYGHGILKLGITREHFYCLHFAKSRGYPVGFFDLLQEIQRIHMGSWSGADNVVHERMELVRLFRVQFPDYGHESRYDIRLLCLIELLHTRRICWIGKETQSLVTQYTDQKLFYDLRSLLCLHGTYHVSYMLCSGGSLFPFGDGKTFYQFSLYSGYVPKTYVYHGLVIYYVYC